MEKEIRSTDGRAMQGPRFLLCDTTGNVGEPSSSDEAYAVSPIQCLNKAVDLNPELIVVRFDDMRIRERESLVELCAALKHNRHTRNRSVLALLHSKHRKLIEDLNRAGVNFVKFIGQTYLDSNRMRKIIDALGPDDRVGRQLEIVCPFLHYSKIDSKHEMTVCGAYLDRLVLGGRRLQELCGTVDHLHCEYYQKPRGKS
jgi:hypothetical protein